MLLEKWRYAIPQADQILLENDVICEHHFPENNIKRFYQTKLSNGTVFKLEMDHPRLPRRSNTFNFPKSAVVFI
ncbi:hypothetical protein X975_04718, partial [Stegodyphus mimosarum]